MITLLREIVAFHLWYEVYEYVIKDLVPLPILLAVIAGLYLFVVVHVDGLKRGRDPSWLRRGERQND